MFLALVLMTVLFYGVSQAEQLKIVIMQDQKGAAQKFKPLVDYMKNRGIDISFVGAPNYTAAAQMFTSGEADAMFSGSGVAGSMIIKGLSSPVVRPVGKDGNSTYWAVVLSKKGSAKYTGANEYFSGKRVIFCSLASSGEFYFHAIGGHKTATEMMNAASHEAAIDALARGTADIAIVKNRVWDKVKDKYPTIEAVGMDKGENPDGTLIVSKSVTRQLAQKIKSALMSLKNDASPEANAVRDSLNIQGYIETTEKDFGHTLTLLKDAGVDKNFNFSFQYALNK